MLTLESLAYTLNHIYLEDRKVKTYEIMESDNNLMAAEPELLYGKAEKNKASIDSSIYSVLPFTLVPALFIRQRDTMVARAVGVTPYCPLNAHFGINIRNLVSSLLRQVTSHP